MSAPIIQAPIKYAGAYIVSGFVMPVQKRPSWMNRFMMRWIFGWDWRDAA